MARQYVPVALKKRVIDRANGCCEYCKYLFRYSAQPFVTEHITPIASGGMTIAENLAFSCGGCNGHKYTKTEALDPVSGQLVPLFNPRLEKWSKHFEWDVSVTNILGLTPTGRATIRTLKMNRPELVNIRNITKLTGEHPPME